MECPLPRELVSSIPMAILPKTAKELCTKPELDLYLQSRAAELEAHTEAKLTHKLARVRRLVTKYRQLAARRAREAKGNGAAGTLAAACTRKKRQLFEEVQDRYQKRLTEVRVQAKREAARARKAERVKKAVDKRKGRRASVAAKRNRTARGGQKRRQTHVAARGRRTQARRDSRRR